MDKKTKKNFKKNIANFFDAAGYFSCTFQWLWVFLLYFTLIESFARFFIQDNPTKTVEPATANGVVNNGSLSVIIVVVITIIMGIITVYILLKMPSIIAKTGKTIVHQTADNIAPVVLQAQNKQDTKKNRTRLSARLVVVIKLLLVILPIVLAVFSIYLDQQIVDFYIVIIVSFWLASFSIMFFAVQYLTAKLFKLRENEIW